MWTTVPLQSTAMLFYFFSKWRDFSLIRLIRRNNPCMNRITSEVHKNDNVANLCVLPKVNVQGRYGVVIQWSLLGSYICFTTTIAETLYNLSIPNYCYWLGVGALTQTLAQGFCAKVTMVTCTVLCKALNMCPWQVSLAGDSGSLIGHLFGTFGGASNFDVADSLGGAYLGPFKHNSKQLVNIPASDIIYKYFRFTQLLIKSAGANWLVSVANLFLIKELSSRCLSPLMVGFVRLQGACQWRSTALLLIKIWSVFQSCKEYMGLGKCKANAHLFMTGQLDLLEFFHNWACFMLKFLFAIFAQFDFI